MLKDRIVLMEHEYVKQKKVCSAMYLELMISATESEKAAYQKELEKMTSMKSEIEMVREMIEDGNP